MFYACLLILGTVVQVSHLNEKKLSILQASLFWKASICLPMVAVITRWLLDLYRENSRGSHSIAVSQFRPCVGNSHPLPLSFILNKHFGLLYLFFFFQFLDNFPSLPPLHLCQLGSTSPLEFIDQKGVCPVISSPAEGAEWQRGDWPTLFRSLFHFGKRTMWTS